MNCNEETMQDTINAYKETLAENTTYHQIVMNLSGKREALENQAHDLINKYGLIGALKRSRVEAKREQA